MSTTKVDPSALSAAAGHGEEMQADTGAVLGSLSAHHQAVPRQAEGLDMVAERVKFSSPDTTDSRMPRKNVPVVRASPREEGIPAGDVALVGSTGTGAQKASQSAVGAGHVWVSATGSAPVTHAPSNYEIVLGGAIAYSMDHPEKAFFQRR
ncbi:alpha/beta hydrolase [Streptomyces noursei]|uniref:alpha/beta hydrolase n=1 Tax=Streptomyces noursei TaxID=1971 RepID=UPI0035D5BE92